MPQSTGSIIPDCDIIHKYFRAKGKTVCIAYLYFDCGVGLAGSNLTKLQKLDELREKAIWMS